MNGETITLTPRAQQRLTVLHALDRGKLTMAQAVQLLGIGDRQVRRLRRAVRERGLAALVHGNRGRLSPRRLAGNLRERVVHLARSTYAGINFQHLSELLAEHEHVSLSRPTIHRILTAAGIRSPRYRRPAQHRRRRERMPREGLLVLTDGSDHDWLEGRGPRLVLLATMDDATGTVLSGEFRDEEDAHGYLAILREMALTKGLPVALYSDRHGIFHRDKRITLTVSEQLQGGPIPTHVERVLQELGIRWIPASSPQAKGRIERLFGTFQDRLRSELRLANVTDRDGANAFLRTFLPRYNARFGQTPAEPESAFRPWPAGLDPATVFCFKYRRQVANDNTVSLPPHQVQILPGPRGRSYAKARVEVHERLDGTVAVFYHGQPLAIHATSASPLGPRVPARPHRRLRPHDLEVAPATITKPTSQPRTTASRRQPQSPPADHPWRRHAREAQRRKELRQAGVTFSRNS